MGLDNGFILHNRKTPDVKVCMATFRNFRELDSWMTQHCDTPSEDSYSYLVKQEELNALLSEIEPIAKAFASCSDGQIAYYDDHGYPESLVMEFYNNEFSPAESGTSFVVYKIIKLWHTLKAILETIEEDYDKDLYFIFYSSC